jgi:hypothetical protein
MAKLTTTDVYGVLTAHSDALVYGGLNVTGKVNFSVGSISLSSPTFISSINTSSATFNIVNTATNIFMGLSATLISIGFNGAGTVTINNTTNSTSISSGALVVDGGVGIAGNVYAGGNINATEFFGSGAGLTSIQANAIASINSTALPTIIQTTGSNFVKITIDTYGRVIGNSLITSTDILNVLGSQYNAGVANGLATLNSIGQLTTSQIPATLVGAMVYQGVWNALTNTPTLVSGTGTKGVFYKISVAGTTNVDGNSTWFVGDVILFDGAVWDRIAGAPEQVTTVFGRIGAVSLEASDVYGITVSSGSTTQSVVGYSGTVSMSGRFDGGTTVPTDTARLNYNGSFYATEFFGFASGLTNFPLLNQNTTGQAGSVANALTIGTGLSGISYNGSAPITIAVVNATNSILGGVIVGNNINVSSGTISIPQSVATTASPTFNNIILTGYENLSQISTPSNPSSGTDNIYVKSDNQLYALSSAGNEVRVGAIPITTSGWTNQNTDATISFNNSTRTITITPSGSTFQIYTSGHQWNLGTQNFIISNTEGNHYIYFNTSGVMTELVNPVPSQISSLFINNCPVAYVYWDATNLVSLIIGDEQHGIKMDGVDHSYDHIYFHTRWNSGLTPNTISANGSGNVNASAQFGIDSGVIQDEDIQLNISAVSATTGLPVFYNSGSGQNLRRSIVAGYSVMNATGGRLYYNNPNAGGTGVWGLTQVVNNDFCLYHVFATNDVIVGTSIISVMGQDSYTTLANAQAGAPVELNNIVVSFPAAEFKPIATFIFQTSNTYANAVKARVVPVSATANFYDWRNTLTYQASTITSSYTLPIATGAILGGVLVPSSGGIAVDTNGNITLENATTSQIGGVKVDGVGITASSGVISLGNATTSTLGGIIVGSGLSVNNGVVSVSGSISVNSVFSTETISIVAETLDYLRSNGLDIGIPYIANSSVSHFDNNALDQNGNKFWTISGPYSLDSVDFITTTDPPFSPYGGSISGAMSLSYSSSSGFSNSYWTDLWVKIGASIGNLVHIYNSQNSITISVNQNNYLEGQLGTWTYLYDSNVGAYHYPYDSTTLTQSPFNYEQAVGNYGNNYPYSQINSWNYNYANTNEVYNIFIEINTPTQNLRYYADFNGWNHIAFGYNSITNIYSIILNTSVINLPNFNTQLLTGDKSINIVLNDNNISLKYDELMYAPIAPIISNALQRYGDRIPYGTNNYLNKVVIINDILVNNITASGNITASTVSNAVWNDIADCIEIPNELKIEYGKVYVMNDNGTYSLSNKYLDDGIMGIASDTYGFKIGEKNTNELPIAIGGFVLAYVNKIYKIGTPLTAGKDGTLTEIMLQDKRDYPEKVVATFWKTEPNETWGDTKNRSVKVNGRMWVKII